MTAVIAQELRLFARRRWPLANDKYRKDRLAELLDLTKRRVKSFWEGSETAVARARETSAIEALIGHRIGEGLNSREATDAVRTSQEKYRLLEARLASLEALLERADEDIGSEYLAGHRALARGDGSYARGEGTPLFGGGPGDGHPGQLDLFD